MSAVRPEYPRPMLRRGDWTNLNGEWDFHFDDDNSAPLAAMLSDAPWDRKIIVPFPFQSPLSGIGETGLHDYMWYRKRFFLPRSYEGKRLLLHFGAVDYRAHVWLNGRLLGSHTGGYTPFTFEITDVVLPGENTLLVKVEDSECRWQPRGKQYWKEEPEGIFYTRCSGIWQTVWLEPVPQTYIASCRVETDAASGRVRLDVDLEGEAESGTFIATLISDGREVATEKIDVLGPKLSLELVVPDARLWSPDSPHLYDLRLELAVPEAEDEVWSYVGIRTVEVDGGRILLNAQPFIFRMTLDQGYYPDSVYTAPSDEAIRRDVELAKSFGFNGVRRHQIVSDPRYLYWCDRLGLCVWAEMANAHEGTPEAVEALRREWLEAVRRDTNHPCIIAWVPYNESWGLPDDSKEAAAVLRDIYESTKALDPTRPVIDNSGWQHVVTDICDVHDYSATGEDLSRRFVRLDALPRVIVGRGRPVWADGVADNGAPIVISEMGGIALEGFLPEGGAVHYCRVEPDVDSFLERLSSLVGVIVNEPHLSGFCYTQLYDVEVEVNGLATYDRRPKVDPARVARIIGMRPASAHDAGRGEQGDKETD